MVCAMPVPNGMQGRNARAVSRSPAQRMAVPGRYLTYTDRLGPTDPEPPTRSITTSTYHENMFDPKRPQIFGTVPSVVAGEPKHSPAAPSITRPAPTTSWLSHDALRSTRQMTFAVEAWERIPGTGAVRAKVDRRPSLEVARTHVASRSTSTSTPAKPGPPVSGLTTDRY